MGEMVDIVDDGDAVVGQADLAVVYRDKLPHRIVHVFVLHPQTGAVFFQRRAKTKTYLPGYWCTSAGGHVRTGESYRQAAARELHEELGLAVLLHAAYRSEYLAEGHQRFIELFVAHASGGFSFNDGEVAHGEFFDLESACALVGRNERIHPQLTLCFRWLYAHQAQLPPGMGMKL